MNEVTEKNYKYIFLIKLFDELGLAQIENFIVQKGIKNLNLKNYFEGNVTNYFSILNSFDFKALSSDEFNKFQQLFSEQMNTLSDEKKHELFEFVEATYKKVLFSHLDTDYKYYGPLSDDYLCPSDAIVLGLFYDIMASSNVDDFGLTNTLADICNYIQFELAKKANKKVAVVTFNQMTMENVPKKKER